MIPLNLTTNEVKNRLGTEIEMIRINQTGRSVEFAYKDEAPNQPYRLSVNHSEFGTGTDKRRRSNVRVEFTPMGATTNLPKKVTATMVVDIPIGDLSSFTPVQDAIAYLISFVASQGATTTILYDGSGYGADALIHGTL